MGPADLLIAWPRRVASHFDWVGPLLARLVVGYVFVEAGWGKLTNLPRMIENFAGWGIPFPQILTPFASGWEFVGGLCLIVGLMTRIASAGLAFTMVVATYAAKRAEIDSLSTLLGIEETTYFVVFVWLAIAGAGRASLDYLIERRAAPA